MTFTPVKTNRTAQTSTADETCQPQALLQPRFYADQILNDADLNALVAWTHDKSRLVRYRDGWGIACGLRVGVNASGERIIVSPGYAVDSCGRDIIVCTDECRRAEISVRDIFDRLARDCALPEGGFRIGEYYSNDKKYVRAVDIYLHYQEEGRTRQPARGRSRDSVRCETSRTLEGYHLAWREVDIDDNPVQARAEAWRTHARNKFNEWFVNRVSAHNRVDESHLWDNWEKLKAALLAAADASGSHEFHLIHRQMDRIWDGKDPSSAREFRNMAHRLFWVGMDCLRAAILSACAACNPDDGVPLARLWLQTHRLEQARVEEKGLKKEGGRAKEKEQEIREHPVRDHRVLLVDNNPPYRRLLHADPYPAPLGSHNFAPYLGRFYDDVHTILSDAGFTNINESPWNVPDVIALGEITDLFSQQWDQLWRPVHRRHSDAVNLNVWDGASIGRRVIGFSFWDR